MDAALFASIFAAIMVALASWCLSESSGLLSRHYGSYLLGSTCFSLLNAAPQAALVIAALNHQRPHFALGALCGSVISLALLALGLAVFFGSSTLRSGNIAAEKSISAQAWVLAMTTPLLVCLMIDGFCLSFSVVGISAYFVYVWHRSGVVSVVSGKFKQDSDSDGAGGALHDGIPEHPSKGLMFAFIGLLILHLYTDDFVVALHQVANDNESSLMFLALVFGPLATQTVEVIEIVTLATRGRRDAVSMGVSNALSHTITQTTLMIGILCLYGYMHKFAWTLAFSTNVAFVALSCLVAAGVVGLSSELSKWHGSALLVVFVFIILVYYHSCTDAITTPLPQSTSVLQSLSASSSVAGPSSSYTSVRRDIVSEINLSPYA